MKLYNQIADAYTTSTINLFCVHGNIHDITLYEEDNKRSIDESEKVLIKNLEKNNHVIYFSPSAGMKYTNPSHLDEFYAIDADLKDIHKKAFSLDYAQTKYDMLSGLHMIKVLLSSYRAMRKKYGSKRVKNLVILVDDADIIFANKPIEHMSNDEKLLLSLAREVLGGSEFINSDDTVILLSSSFFAVHEGVRVLSGLHSIEVPLPNDETRHDFITYENALYQRGLSEKQIVDVAANSAGIMLTTLRSILKQKPEHVTKHIKNEVARIIEKELGKYVKVLHPAYGFDNVIGYETLKEKATSLIKRMKSKNPWQAIAYIGATGTGKDFQTEAFLYEAGIPVIKLLNIKSKWYGETAIIVEKIKMVARSFSKIAIFKPEADKLFPDPEAREADQTDQELTAIFLDWMAASSDRGKIFWVFNTSRPQMFPVDFQRRIEIKLPIFDLEDEERESFIVSMFERKGIKLKGAKKKSTLQSLVTYTKGFSSDNIRMMASEVASELEIHPKSNINAIVEDLNFDIVTQEREQQSIYAANFSTYKSLIATKYKS